MLRLDAVFRIELDRVSMHKAGSDNKARARRIINRIVAVVVARPSQC